MDLLTESNLNICQFLSANINIFEMVISNLYPVLEHRIPLLLSEIISWITKVLFMKETSILPFPTW